MTIEKPFRIDLREEFPHLSKAPIVEGVLEWTAEGREGLEAEYVQNELVRRLPDYPEFQPQRRLQYLLEPGETPASPVPKLKNSEWAGFQFFSADKRCIAQFTRDRFVFSRLSPYTDWDKFSVEANRLWRIFVEVFEPEFVHRLGLRFINRMSFHDISELPKLLACLPAGLSGIGLPMKEFTLQATHSVPDYPYSIQVIQAIQPPTSSADASQGLILDIDVSDETVYSPDEDFLGERLLEMRWLKNKIFMSIVSDSALSSFR